jgi:hypothetical protein
LLTAFVFLSVIIAIVALATLAHWRLYNDPVWEFDDGSNEHAPVWATTIIWIGVLLDAIDSSCNVEVNG